MAVSLTVAKVLDDAVADFKAAFAANSALITFGQFQVTEATIIAVIQRIQAELPAVGSVDPDVRTALVSFISDDRSQAKADAVLATIKRKKLEATFPETVKVFSPDAGATPAWANRLFKPIRDG